MEIWSVGTALRNPNRIPSFMNCLYNFNGFCWNEETQLDYYIDLIRAGVVRPNKISATQLNVPPEMARALMNDRYMDAPMRGRVIGSLFQKLGFIELVQGCIVFSDTGESIINRTITLEQALTTGLTNWQYINIRSQWNEALNLQLTSQNFSPFVAVLYLIDRVNQISQLNTGITYEEYDFFAKTLDNYDLVDTFVNFIVCSRIDSSHRINFKNYVRNTCDNFLNSEDYSDNDKKYFVATGLIISDDGFVNLDYNQIGYIRSIIQNNIPGYLPI